MKQHVILSYNNNPDYIYFAPLTIWAWNRIGWKPVLMWADGDGITPYNALVKSHTPCDFETIKVKVDGYRSETIAQVSRLYAACVFNRGAYLMTGDIDMIPLSNYWQPTNGKPTVWGYDLTGYTHYPICYIGMSSEYWLQVMDIRDIGYNEAVRRDLDTMSDANDPDFYKWWFVDQELITRRLKRYQPTVINRGQYPNGFARGRIDRGAWTLDHKEFIDCHMHHQIHHKQNDWKFKQTLEMLRRVWPGEDFKWYEEYHHEFKRLTGHA